MGWETEVIIIAESIESKEIAHEIGHQLFLQDSKYYEKEDFYIFPHDSSYAFYYCYERRKYLPYWVILEISKNYSSTRFTLLGSMIEFLCGPCGLIRIQNGNIEDSYGIYGDSQLDHQRVLNSPVKHRKIIFDWFRKGGKEEEIRMKHLNEFPLGWCDDNFTDKIIPIDAKELIEKIENVPHKIPDWEKQERFKILPGPDEYLTELKTTTQTELEITERNFLSFIAYNPILARIENRMLEILNGESNDEEAVWLYRYSFGDYSKEKEFLKDELKTIQDIEDAMVENEDALILWTRKRSLKWKVKKFDKGFSFKWFVEMMEEERAKSDSQKGYERFKSIFGDLFKF